MPKRTSLPSMLPSATATPSFWWIGLPAASACQQTSVPATNSANMAPHTAQPWRWFFTNAAEIPRERARNGKDREHLEKNSRAGSGFSKGCAALAFRKPPPFVPIILMADLRSHRALGDGLRVDGLVDQNRSLAVGGQDRPALVVGLRDLDRIGSKVFAVV